VDDGWIVAVLFGVKHETMSLFVGLLMSKELNIVSILVILWVWFRERKYEVFVFLVVEWFEVRNEKRLIYIYTKEKGQHAFIYRLRFCLVTI
jgi:hypothetical protein